VAALSSARDATAGAVTAVIFDLDDTLYPESSFVHGGFRAVAEHLSATSGLPAAQLAGEMRRLHDEEGRGAIFDRLLDIHSLASHPAAVAELVHLYRTHPPAIVPYDDVVPTLEALHRAGVRLGLLTDGMASVQRRKVEALGLARRLDALVFTDEIDGGRPKPDPSAYRVALERLGARADRAVYVGNDPTKDFAGARLLGLTTVRVGERPRHGPAPWLPEEDADVVVARFETLTGVVAGLGQRGADG
jgi:putative hydrolase of the HAD superfamily